MVVKERQSNFELLRIIIMLLIIFSHSIGHGLIFSGFAGEQSITEQAILNQMTIFGKVAVGIFIMVTGYFMCQSQFSFSKFWKRLLSLWLQLIFYSAVLFAIALKFNWIDLSAKSFFDAFFPITTSAWWFATTYVMLYFFIPYLNIWINNLTKKQYQGLVLVFVFILSIYPTLFRGYNPTDGTNISSIIMFMMFYIIGAYFRKYTYKNARTERNIALVSFVGLLILNCIQSFFLGYLTYNTGNSIYLSRSEDLGHMSSIIVIGLMVSMFLIFKNLNIKSNKIINTLALTIFGVYLLHDNSYTREKLWGDWVNVVDMYIKYDFLEFFLRICLVVGLIFIICASIEYLRIQLFKVCSTFFRFLKRKDSLQGKNEV